MGKVVLITGPARSGKSEWAEMLAMQFQSKVFYVATATDDPQDLEWQQRLQLHRQRRSADWVTLEVPVDLAATLSQNQPNVCFLVDSLGTWVANLLSQDEKTWQNTVDEFLLTLQNIEADAIFVAEETGWGVVPAYPIGRTFRDRLGSLVRRLGAIANPVYLVTGGHVLNLSLIGSPIPQK